MRQRSFFTVALALLTLGGCAHYSVITQEPPPIDALGEPPYGLAQICVLRPHSLGALVPFAVRDNGRLVGATRGPSYFCYFVQPGWHRVTSDSGNVATVDLTAAPGARHYLHQIVRIGDDELVAIDERAAAAMLPRCEYQVLVEPRPDDPNLATAGAPAAATAVR